MLNVVHREHVFSYLIVAYRVGRHNQTRADSVDQLFNSAEKRLARTFCCGPRFGKKGRAENVVPSKPRNVAEMRGSTRAGISFFMNRFRLLGLIGYNAGLEVHSSLLDIVLQE
jgi:CRP/FNR family transcriptional regulator, cyclic AMP receptor protein